MKLNQLIRNANIILSSNPNQSKKLPRNRSFISSLNINSSKSNLSITTNATIINSPRKNKINLIGKTPKLSIHNYFNKGSINNNSLPVLFPLSPRIKRPKINFFKEADIIVKDRFKNHDLISAESKKSIKNKVLNISRDISLKNYIIKLLIEKRSEIYDKERIMNNALNVFNSQFKIDNKMFNEFIDETLIKQKEMENFIVILKAEREKKEKILNDRRFEIKRIENDLEKQLKLLYNSKKYAIFVHELFEIPFNYKDLPDLNRFQSMENIINKIIYIYNTKDKFCLLPPILKDEQLLIQKFNQLEEKITHNITIRDILVKEIYQNNEYYKKELKTLENNYKEYEKDFKILKDDLNMISKSMNSLKIHDNGKIENYMRYIIELGKQILFNIPTKSNDIDEYSAYCKNILLTLEKKEVDINNYINEIDIILKFGEKKEKSLLEKCILDRRKINKAENQLRLKKRQEEIENEKNMRYLRRAQRFVVKGRNVSPIFPLIKHVKKIKKIDINKKNKNNDEIECVYSATDDEK